VNALLDVAGVAKDNERAEHLAAWHRLVGAEHGDRRSNHYQRASGFVDVRFCAKPIACGWIHEVDLELDRQDG
jgi:hypothetical protein